MRISYFWLIISVSYMALIWYFSSQPEPPIPAGIMQIAFFDKILHTIEFFILAIFLFLAFRYTNHPYIAAILIAVMYGVIDEYHQYFISRRVFDIYDIAANSLGSFIITMKYPKRIDKIKV